MCLQGDESDDIERSSNLDKQAMVVHTKDGPTLIAGNCWPCLNTPLKDSKVASDQKLGDKDDYSSQVKGAERCLKQGGLSCVISEDLVDVDSGRDFWEGVEAESLHTVSKLKGCVGLEIIRESEGWLTAKKKGKKTRVIEPQLATRKSSRIQDQGIPIE